MVGISAPTFLRLGIITEIAIAFLLGLRLYMTRGRTKCELREKIAVSAYAIACVMSIYDLIYFLWAANRYIGWEDAFGKEQAMKLQVQEASRPWELRTVFAGMLTYINEIWLVKLAFLAFYSGLFTQVDEKRMRLLWFSSAYIFAAYIVAIGYTVGFCRPVSSNWAPEPAERCLAAYAMEVYIVISIMHISSEFLLIALPLTILKSLTFKKAERSAVTFVLFMGSVSIVTSLVRFSIFIGLPLVAPLGTKLKVRTPGTVELSNAIMYTDAIEKVSMFIAYCLPSMRRLLKHKFVRNILTKPFPSFQSSKGGDNEGSKRSWSINLPPMPIKKNLRHMLSTDQDLELSLSTRDWEEVNESETQLTRSGSSKQPV